MRATRHLQWTETYHSVFGRWKASLIATTVVLLVLVLVVTHIRKMLVNTQRKVTKLRIHIRDIIPDRSTVLDFYQMAPPSGFVVPFVLVLN